MLHDAIQSLRPGKGFTMYADDPDTIIWQDETVTTPTKTEIAAAIKSLEAKKIADQNEKETARTALLQRLGITQEEATLLLG